MSEKFEERPWGHFIVLDDEGYGKVKRIHVKPKQKLSYQSHEKRSEVWVVQQGNGRAIIDDEIKEVMPGAVIVINAGRKHRIINDHDLVPLVFTEVQIGVYYGEDDIVRYSDEYGRVQNENSSG
jgi:mannose-6-phosphate isomerase-like protein (cupin superfamily)